MRTEAQRGARTALTGLIVNAVLVAIKIGTGLLGNSYALVADGVESATDVFSSIIVWRGISISTRSADDEFHFGYGKAETVSAAAVSVMLLVAAFGIAIEAIREIITPHEGPAAFTLFVLVAVIALKETMFRKVRAVSGDMGSRALETDAWHHRSDAITSAAAFVGISIAVVGGPSWAPADDWAALVASVIIAVNGFRLLRPAVADLMDRAPPDEVLNRVREIAFGVEGVLDVEKVQARRAGMGYLVAIHVQADPDLSLRDAHILGGRVRSAVQDDRQFLDALVHMEPYEAETS
jgi:cation diffusion facilitator family transporter